MFKIIINSAYMVIDYYIINIHWENHHNQDEQKIKIFQNLNDNNNNKKKTIIRSIRKTNGRYTL